MMHPANNEALSRLARLDGLALSSFTGLNTPFTFGEVSVFH
ncbi:MAG: hypothetical protein ACTIKR_19125 [Advenella sp.]